LKQIQKSINSGFISTTIFSSSGQRVLKTRFQISFFSIEIELYREGLNFVEERLVPASPGHSKKVSARMHQDVTGCARKT
jgi:hypothetical protein